MAEEKNQGAGTATVEAPGENTVQITFPSGRPSPSSMANCLTRITARKSRCLMWR